MLWQKLTATISALTLMAGLAVVSRADQNQTDQQQNEQATRQERAEHDQSQNQSDTVEQQLTAFQDLSLTGEQKEQLRRVIRENDRKMARVWRQFQMLHGRAVTLEAVMLAAIEDQLDEPQKEQFRKLRQHHHSGMARGQESQRRETLKPNLNQQPATTPQDNHQDQPRIEPLGSDVQRKDLQKHAGRNAPEAEVVEDHVAVLRPSDMIRELGLSGQKKEQCDELCAAYQKSITSIWQQIHATHLQLVVLEADKLASVEHVLTSEQIQHLRQLRRSPRLNPNTALHEQLSREIQNVAPEESRERK